MGFSCEILADSINRYNDRLTTFKISFPRSILAEFNTHRVLSRNAASSRAIPIEKMIQQVLDDPFIPVFRKNGKGMQGYEKLNKEEQEKATEKWLDARFNAINTVKNMSIKEGLNIHKQYINRLLEPWMWATVVVSATEWSNFFALRNHEAAEPSFQKIAKMMEEQYKVNEPIVRSWHLPYIKEQDIHDSDDLNYQDVEDCLKEKGFSYDFNRFENRLFDISTGRCAKVSYLSLDTNKVDLLNDIRLAVQLSSSYPGHWSPFEHCAKSTERDFDFMSGNFRGWFQYRKEFKNENITPPQISIG